VVILRGGTDDNERGRQHSNKDWVHPLDTDAEIMKMKDGRTHLAHKQEQAVDMESGAVVAVTLSGGATHDTKTVEDTLEQADNNLAEAKSKSDDSSAERVSDGVKEVVLDKGYHSNDVLMRLDESCIRSYVSEPKRGRRRWKNKATERDVVYANRRRTRGERGKELLRRRGELLERPFAHALETGGMRRTHLRKHDNILKRLLVHIAGFNLNLLMRTLFGVGKPRVLQGRPDLARDLREALLALWDLMVDLWVRLCPSIDHHGARLPPESGVLISVVPSGRVRQAEAFTTGC